MITLLIMTANILVNAQIRIVMSKRLRIAIPVVKPEHVLNADIRSSLLSTRLHIHLTVTERIM